MEQTLSGKVLQVSSMPCFHLAPQYVLLGVAEALVTPACACRSIHDGVFLLTSFITTCPL